MEEDRNKENMNKSSIRVRTRKKIRRQEKTHPQTPLQAAGGGQNKQDHERDSHCRIITKQVSCVKKERLMK